MTSRERWTVYPLLFLSLGMGLRSRLPGSENASSVQCQNLTVLGRTGNPLIRLGSTMHDQGVIEFLSQGKPLLVAGGSQDGSAGQLLLQNSDGKPQVRLASKEKSGIVQVCGPDGSVQLDMRCSKRGGNLAVWLADQKLVMMIGHDDHQPGIFAIDAKTGKRAASVPFERLVQPITPLTPPEPQPKPDASQPTGPVVPPAQPTPSDGTVTPPQEKPK